MADDAQIDTDGSGTYFPLSPMSLLSLREGDISDTSDTAPLANDAVADPEAAVGVDSEDPP